MRKWKAILKKIFLNLTSLIFAGSLLLIPGSNFYSTLTLSPGESEVAGGEDLIEVSLYPKKVGSEDLPQLTATSVLVIDPDSAVVVYEKNARERVYPASTTKLMTALVAMEVYSPETPILVGEVAVPRQRVGLVRGDRITLEGLLYGLLVSSGNDAAEVLASSFPGGRNIFIERMNVRAAELHLPDTHFMNPTGIDEEGHYSTAMDLSRLAIFALKDPLISQIVATKEWSVLGANGGEYKLHNINELLWEVPGVIGVKTGFTDKAGETLIALTEREGRRIVTVVLGSKDRFGESRTLIEWVYKNYQWVLPDEI